MINWAHIHLVINHVPVVGIFGPILLLLYAILKKSEEAKMLSMAGFVLIALATIPVYLTGDPASDTIKNLPGVTATIGTHEEIASYTLILMEMVGVAALAGLIFLRRSGSIPIWIVATVLMLSLLTAGALGLTANLGGKIRHTEIRAGVTVSPVGTTQR